MKQTLIKLNEQHYIVVDDFDIYKEDFVYYKSVNNSLNPPKNGIYKVEKITNKIIQFYNNEGLVDVSSCKKVTHSTQPLGFLNEDGITTANLKPYWSSVKPLSLSEVEEAIYRCSLDNKIAKHLEKNHIEASPKRVQVVKSLVEELVKDKLFTEKDMEIMFGLGAANHANGKPSFQEAIQSLLPKTEWDVTFDEQGKIEKTK